MGKIMRNDVEYGGGSGGGGDVSQLEQRVERLEDDVDSLERYKVTQLTFNTGIDIGDWDRVIDPDEPVIYEKYVNYHDAVAKLSQQIDVMGNRTDDLKTSLNGLVKSIQKTYTFNSNGFAITDLSKNDMIILGVISAGNDWGIYVPQANNTAQLNNNYAIYDITEKDVTRNLIIYYVEK